MFSSETIKAIAKAAAETGISPAALLAVAEVESGGKAFARIDGRDEPLIRFEGHYFDRRLSPDDRVIARSAGLSSPQAGRIANPKTQSGCWRLLARAAAVDRKAAYESVSWGLGQVMGVHWAWLGYSDVDALVAQARGGALGQARLMARYIDKAGLAGALRARDWTAFARGYNGPDYRRNAYHLKLAAAYRRALRTAAPEAGAVLRQDWRGDAVGEVQLALTALGYPLIADGIYGPATIAAVSRFQKERGLSVDGIAGQKTRAALEQALASSRGSTNIWTRMRELLGGLLSWRGSR